MHGDSLHMHVPKKTLIFILIPFLFIPCCRSNEVERDIMPYESFVCPFKMKN